MATARKGFESEVPPALRVLLVDDEPDVRRVMQRGLERSGFTTVEAANGRVAFELLKRESFDLVISDVQMPIMTGVELLEALARERIDVPVLLVSGSLHVEDAGKARALGAFGLFRKPFALNELATVAYRAALSRRDSVNGLRAPAQGQVVPAPRRQRRLGSVLVVDDYEDARHSLHEVLETAGYHVIEAANGEQAFGCLTGSSEDYPDLIILDLEMPVMDGWSFLRLVKSYARLAKIPIIVASAHEPGLAQLSNGAVFGCLRAPYPISRLLDMVSAAAAPGSPAP